MREDNRSPLEVKIEAFEYALRAHDEQVQKFQAELLRREAKAKQQLAAKPKKRKGQWSEKKERNQRG